MRIEVDILSYWRSGTGAGKYGSLDAVCARDGDGLPYLPGRHLKGLLRDAVDRASQLGWLGKSESNWVNTLFGEQGFVEDFDDEKQAYTDTEPGALRIDSAHLSEDEIAGLNERPDLKDELFETLRSTKINPQSGAAEDGSLRFEEVAIPLKLYFEIHILAQAPNWETTIKSALPLIRAVGQKRTRGLGRAVFKLCEK